MSLDLSPSELVIRGSDGSIRTSTNRQEFICTDFISGTYVIAASEQNAASAQIVTKLDVDLGPVNAAAEYVLGHFKINHPVTSYIGGASSFVNDGIYPIGGTVMLFSGQYRMRPLETASYYRTTSPATQGSVIKRSAGIAVTFSIASSRLVLTKEIYFPYLANGASDQVYVLGDLTINYFAFACGFSVL